MSNPIAPIVPSPFFPHPGTTSTVLPGTINRGFALGGAVVGAPYFYDYPYNQGITSTTITIPGLPPGARYEDYIDPRNSYRGLSPAQESYPPQPEPSRVLQQPEPELRLIIREPDPNRVIQVPTIGTSRADVIKKLGEPWGVITVRGVDTLYFEDVSVVIGTDGRVTAARLQGDRRGYR
jgi:hypothetical protein